MTFVDRLPTSSHWANLRTSSICECNANGSLFIGCELFYWLFDWLSVLRGKKHS